MTDVDHVKLYSFNNQDVDRKLCDKIECQCEKLIARAAITFLLRDCGSRFSGSISRSSSRIILLLWRCHPSSIHKGRTRRCVDPRGRICVVNILIDIFVQEPSSFTGHRTSSAQGDTNNVSIKFCFGAVSKRLGI